MKLKTIFKILIVTSIVLPALIVGVVGTSLYTGFYTDMLVEDSAAAAYVEAKTQSLFFESVEGELSVLAKNDDIRHAAGGDYTAIKDRVDSIISDIAAGENVIDVLITDSNGNVITNAKSEIPLAQTLFEGYDDDMKNAAGNGGVYISPLFVDDSKYGTHIVYVTQAVAAPTGATGYIAAALDAAKLNESLANATFFKNEGKIMLIDGKKNKINAGGEIARDGEGVAVREFTDEMLSALSEEKRFISFSEGGYCGSYGRIENSDWVWVGTYPISSATGELVFPLMFGYVVLSAFLVIDALIAFAIYRRAISPIGTITATMSEINAGDRTKRLPNFSTYEYQIVTEAFNDLLDDAYVSEDVHRTIAELSKSLLFEWDIETKKMYLSKNFSQVFDFDASAVTLTDGNFIDSIMDEGDAKHYVRDMNALLNNDREKVESEYLMKNKDGSDIWIELKVKAVVSKNGTINGVIGVLTDITGKKNTSLQLSQKASYDFLSQLYNRSTFLRELQKIIDRRRPEETFAIFFIDVDDFKFINDRYGHNVGDEVIKYVADLLKDCIGDKGIAGRFGGDEFVLCSTDSELSENSSDFAMSIIDKMYSGYKCEAAGAILNVQVSIGISLINENGADAETLVGQADEAMYFVKKNGKANYHIYEPDSGSGLDSGNTIF